MQETKQRRIKEVQAMRTGKIEMWCGVLILSYKKNGWKAEYWTDDDTSKDTRHVVSGYPSRIDVINAAKDLIVNKD